MGRSGKKQRRARSSRAVDAGAGAADRPGAPVDDGGSPHGGDGSASHGGPGPGGHNGRLARRRPVLWAVAVFITVMAAFYGVDYYTPLFSGDGVQAYLAWIARASAAILRLLGQEATPTGTSIISPGFSVRIVRGCDAIEPVVAFVAAVLASPVAWRLRLVGLVVGTTGLLLVNLVRIVSLFFIGVYFRTAFDLMHYELWQAAFIALAIAFWAVWVQWATRRQKGGDHAAV